MSRRMIWWLKVVVHVGCALPFLWLLWGYHSGGLANQADPVNYITHFTGNWALWLLLGDLAITPVRRLSPELAWLIRFRRMVGLWAFYYATLHLLTYVLLFSGYDVPTAVAGLRAGHVAEPWRQLVLVWPTMLDDVLKRRFIQVGLLAYVILLMLAVTSPQRMLRAMGGKNWQRLHRLIYVAGFAAVVHYMWMVKAGVRTPYKYAALIWILLLARVFWWVKERLRKRKVLRVAGA